MGETAGTERIESKVDELLGLVNNLDRKVQSVGDQQVSDRKLHEQMFQYQQQAITRLQSELDDEKKARAVGDDAIKATLSHIGFALFTSLLVVVAGVITYLLTHGR